MNSCRGCGSLLDLSDTQISQAVEEVLESTRTDTTALGRVCPLCGHPTSEPVSHRKSIQVALLIGLLVLVAVLIVAYYAYRDTERQQAVDQALQQLRANGEVTRYLGTSIATHGEIMGQVKQDETGWREVRLTIPVRGSITQGVVHVIGGRTTAPWQFTTFDIVIEKARKRIDLIAGRVVDLSPEAFVEVHTQAAATPVIPPRIVPPARWDGRFPCLTAAVSPGSRPSFVRCAMPVPMTAFVEGPVDRCEVDLRFGKFILHQTDLLVQDRDLTVPLTRTYTSEFRYYWARSHAFGFNSTHDFDVGLVGSRNPYTYLMMVLPDGDGLYFPRISEGGGYADAVYQHTETSSVFYKATVRWAAGGGWESKRADGATMRFPESYHAKNMAQGAPTEMVDAQGNRVQLIRDPQRNLQEVRTPNGRHFRLGHDSGARVVRAEDDQGHSVEYRYSNDGMLTDANHSDGRSRHYTYVDHLMTRIQDEKGRVLIRNQYRDGWLVEQDYGNGQVYRISYELGDNRHYAVAATVQLPNGTARSFPTGDSVYQFVKELARQ